MKEITLACEAFQKLLEEQLERIRNMNGEKTDFSTKKQVIIGVIDGDGIGPIITAQATRVLEKLLAEEIAAGSIVIKQKIVLLAAKPFPTMFWRRSRPATCC